MSTAEGAAEPPPPAAEDQVGGAATPAPPQGDQAGGTPRSGGAAGEPLSSLENVERQGGAEGAQGAHAPAETGMGGGERPPGDMVLSRSPLAGLEPLPMVHRHVTQHPGSFTLGQGGTQRTPSGQVWVDGMDPIPSVELGNDASPDTKQKIGEREARGAIVQALMPLPQDGTSDKKSPGTRRRSSLADMDKLPGMTRRASKSLPATPKGSGSQPPVAPQPLYEVLGGVRGAEADAGQAAATDAGQAAATAKGSSVEEKFEIVAESEASAAGQGDSARGGGAEAQQRPAAATPRQQQAAEAPAQSPPAAKRLDGNGPQPAGHSPAGTRTSIPGTVHAAAHCGDAAALQALVDGGAKVDQPDRLGYTPLHFAACYGHDDAVELLLRLGASTTTQCQQGWTPLHVAARGGRVGSTKLLLDKGCEVDSCDKLQWTALHNAACNGNVEVIQTLVGRGSNVNAQDKDGWTALHFAGRFNNVEAVEKLIALGADPNLQDVDGWTAMHNSARNGHNRCVKDTHILKTPPPQALILGKGNPSIQTRYQENVLHVASRKGKAKVVAIIVKITASEGTLESLRKCEDHHGNTAEMISSTPHIRHLIAQTTDPADDHADATSYEVDGDSSEKTVVSSSGSSRLFSIMGLSKSKACSIQ